MDTTGAIEYFRSQNAFVVDERKLHLTDSGIGDCDIECLEELPDLEHLVLTQTSITDRSLPIIAKLVHLEMLDLSDTSVTDAISVTLMQLPKLRVLGLYGTRITDLALDTIVKLPDIKMLNISMNPQISDAGFRKLVALKRLRALEIHNTNVSSEAISDFSMQCPEVLLVS
jgi:Leucine-rich repeat (LRR) protein